MKLIGILAGVLLMTSVAFADDNYVEWMAIDETATNVCSCSQIETSSPMLSNPGYESGSGVFEEYESSWTWMYEM